LTPLSFVQRERKKNKASFEDSKKRGGKEKKRGQSAKKGKKGKEPWECSEKEKKENEGACLSFSHSVGGRNEEGNDDIPKSRRGKEKEISLA